MQLLTGSQDGGNMKDNKGFWDRWAKRYDFMMSKDGRTYAQIVASMKENWTGDVCIGACLWHGAVVGAGLQEA